MTVAGRPFGTVPYAVEDQVTKPFSAIGVVLTLLNLGPGVVHVSTTSSVGPGKGIPLNPGATVQWDPKNECYAVTDAGTVATLLATDNSGALSDPAVIADAISNTAITAVGIANAIAASGLTAAAIAAAITSDGTPVLLQRLGIPSAVGAVDWQPNVWVNGVAQAAGWLVPAGKELVVLSASMQLDNANAAKGIGRLQLLNPANARVYGALAARVGVSAVAESVVTFGNGAVVFPSQSAPTFREVSAFAGVTYDLTLTGVLFP